MLGSSSARSVVARHSGPSLHRSPLTMTSCSWDCEATTVSLHSVQIGYSPPPVDSAAAATISESSSTPQPGQYQRWNSY